jgi:hypothetical protein
MFAQHTVHIERTDTVGFSDPSKHSQSGCLKVMGKDGGTLYLFPPADLVAAHCFLAELIARATDLDNSVMDRLEALCNVP